MRRRPHQTIKDDLAAGEKSAPRHRRRGGGGEARERREEGGELRQAKVRDGSGIRTTQRSAARPTTTRAAEAIGMNNRRLVPMPTRKARAEPEAETASAPPQPALPPHVVFPSGEPFRRSVWPPRNYGSHGADCHHVHHRRAVAVPAFFFLICAVYFLGRGWFWLCRRRPLAAWFILGWPPKNSTVIACSVTAGRSVRPLAKSRN